MLHWARESALPPVSLVAALQAAQIDPSVELFYPNLSRRISDVLQSTRISSDQEYKTKYRQLRKICASMDEAVTFMKNKDSCRNTKDSLACIKKSLPVLEIFQSEAFLNDIAEYLLLKTRNFDLHDSDWAIARSIALNLMANNVEWVAAKFYGFLAEMVKSVLIGDEAHQVESEKCLTLLCDVSRMALSDSCWWRLLASLLPVLPLLHAYAAHETLLGQAICKSLDKDIAECMGVSKSEIITGLVRLVFVKCVAVQLDAAHTLCRLLDDDRYLPPRESLRADVFLNALRRIQPQEFNIDFSSTPSKTAQATGLSQILDVLKQDIIFDEHGTEYVTRSTVQPSLEPSLRRNTLQQLSVMMRQQDMHEAFLQYDGLKVIVATLSHSSFPRKRFSGSTLRASAITGGVGWVRTARVGRVPTSRASPAAVQWLLAEELWRTSIRVHWWCANVSRSKVLLEAPPPPAPLALRPCARDLALLRAACPVYSSTKALLALENATSHRQKRCIRAMFHLKMIDSCKPFFYKYNILTIPSLYIFETAMFVKDNPDIFLWLSDLASLPWQHTQRFISAPPASSRDAALLTSLLHFVLAYLDNVPMEGNTMTWIISSFIGNDATIISLLSRTQLYPQQTSQDNIEVTQVHIHIVKVLIRCVVMLESHDDYDSGKMESLLKILLACLERIDLKNFHMLGYLNELMRCIRHTLNSRYCFLSEDTLIHCLKITSLTLSGCASGGGRKGQACRLDAMLSLLALLRQIHEEAIPVQPYKITSLTLNDCASRSRRNGQACRLHPVLSLLTLMRQIHEEAIFVQLSLNDKNTSSGGSSLEL
ncbi:putative rotatin, partial [Operophtera brumata]